ncbi:MAG: isoprenylcysteine carboxylmethyltransferase family protein [Gemmatimonadales bacterium]
MNPSAVVGIAWLASVVSWGGAALWSGRTETRVPRDSREVRRYRLCLVVGLVLLSHWFAGTVGAHPLWFVRIEVADVLAVICVAGLLFTWWARLHLGRLWSGSVTRKVGHRVVDSGPYAIVRHPIYTGILAAVVATAALKATIPALLSLGFVFAGLWLKASLEERFLAEQLGADAYGAYRLRVPMLIPFGRRYKQP